MSIVAYPSKIHAAFNPVIVKCDDSIYPDENSNIQMIHIIDEAGNIIHLKR